MQNARGLFGKERMRARARVTWDNQRNINDRLTRTRTRSITVVGTSKSVARDKRRAGRDDDDNNYE